MKSPPLILIVDDNPANVEIFQMRLAANHYDIITAVDGEAGLRMAREHLPDLILLDIMMPKIDGYEVCQRIRSDPSLKDIHIIMITAKGRDVEKEKGLALGADYYITKPFSTREVVMKIKEMLTAEPER